MPGDADSGHNDRMRLNSGEILFAEEQRFRQWWLWTLVLGLPAGICVLLATSRIARGEDLIGIAFPMLFGAIAFALIRLIRLRAEVRPDGIHIYFRPFTPHRHIRLDEIVAFAARTYKPIREYGGWGWRSSPWSGGAYNVSGNRGLQLRLKGPRGEHYLLIGSRQAEAFERALEQASGRVADPLAASPRKK